MEHLKSMGNDYVRDWPSQSLASESYFMQCWNKDNKNGLQVVSTGENEYSMIFTVSEMDMGSGAASMFIGFGAGGAKMSAMMYIFKGNNNVPVLTVEIDGQTGRSAMTELARRVDLYGELAEDLVKTLEKTKQAKIPASTKAVSLPTSVVLPQISSTESSSNATEASATKEVEVTESTPKTKAKAKQGTATTKTAVIGTPVEVQPVNEAGSKTTAKATTKAVAAETPAEVQPAAMKTTSGVPNTVLEARSYLSTDKHGEGGSVACLRSERKVSLYLDFSEALINNYDEEGFIEYMATSARGKDRDPEFATTWEKTVKKKLTGVFMAKVNEELADEKQSARLTMKQGEKYTLKVIVKEINDDGDNQCDYYIIETETGEVVAQYSLEVDGGHVGRLVGLMEDGFSNAGEEFGELLAKKIKKGK